MDKINYLLCIIHFNGVNFMNLIETGKIVNTHGIHGDLKIMPWAQTPDVLLDIEIFYI